jgi:anti-sigma factor RsiW
VSHCRAIHPLLETHLDGELPQEKTFEVDQHLAECGTCRERLHLMRAVKSSTRHAVLSGYSEDALATDSLRNRIQATLRAEREREGQRAEHQEQRAGVIELRPLSWKAIVPIASVAAAVFVVFFAMKRTRGSDGVVATGDTKAESAGMIDERLIDQFMDEAVADHVDPSKPRLTEASQLEALERQVEVPVHVPRLVKYDARWEGARLMPVRNWNAASLRYRVSNHKVTLYVYNSNRFPLRVRLEPQVIRDSAVMMGKRRGYSIAAVERQGLGYAAVATDLEPRETGELVLASLH